MCQINDSISKGLQVIATGLGMSLLTIDGGERKGTNDRMMCGIWNVQISLGIAESLRQTEVNEECIRRGGIN